MLHLKFLQALFIQICILPSIAFYFSSGLTGSLLSARGRYFFPSNLPAWSSTAHEMVFVQESARLTSMFFNFCAPEWSLRAWQSVCAQIFSAQYILSSLVFKHILLNSVLVYFSQFCFNEACSKQMKIYKPLNLFIAFKCTVASTSDWPPDKNVMPGTATGVVLCRVVTVASATCSGVYFVGQDWPVKI